MTRKEKLKAINDRIGHQVFDEPKSISVMMIAKYLDTLAERGIVETPYAVTDKGSRYIAIAEEFGWEVTDSEIKRFCEDMMPPEQVDGFVFLLKSTRDNPS